MQTKSTHAYDVEVILGVGTTPVCLSPGGADAFRTAAPPDALLIGTANGVVRLDRDPQDGMWEEAGDRALEGWHVAALACGPGGRALLAGTYGQGLLRSDDQGVTWTPTGCQMGPHVTALAVGIEPGGRSLYAATAPAHLYHSRDFGESWQELPAFAAAMAPGSAGSRATHARRICCDAANGSCIDVHLLDGRVLRSEDGGRIFGARGGGWPGSAAAALRLARVECLHRSPHDPQTLFVAGPMTCPDKWAHTGSARAIIGRSCDEGRTWSRIRGGLPRAFAGNIEAMSAIAWPGGFGFCVGTSDGEVYVSLDGSATWRLVTRSVPPIGCPDHNSDLERGRALIQSAYAAAVRMC